jgi:TPR repeat protein
MSNENYLFEIFEYSSKLLNYSTKDSYFKNDELNKKVLEYYLNRTSKDSDCTMISQYLNNIGFMYLRGIGVTEDKEKAIYYFNLAKEQGNVYAYYNLAKINKEKSLEYYTYCIENGIIRANYEIGEIYYDKQNFTKAFHHYKIAADNGREESLCMVGYMYLLGKGTIKDVNKALYYVILAGKDDKNGQKILGNMYESGIGVPRDYARAFELYTLSANNGNIAANYNLGQFYEKGLSVDIDIDKAVYHYNIAAKKGNTNAISALKKFEKKTIKDVSVNCEDKCSICLESFLNNSKSIITLVCSHNFHYKCLKGNKNKLCPLCRYEYKL